MRSWFVLILCLVLLAACGSPSTRPTADELERLLLQSGDLPSTVSRGQLRQTAPGVYAELGVPPTDVVVHQVLEESGASYGSVTVSVYPSDEEGQHGYAVLERNLQDAGALDGELREIDDLGTRATLWSASALPARLLAIQRCGAVINMRTTADADTLLAYARRLDARLEPVVCR